MPSHSGCIQPVMDELSSWTEYARVSSATLLQTLFVGYHDGSRY